MYRGESPLSVLVTRWDEKAGLRTGCGVRSQVIDVLEAQIKRRPAMKKVSIRAAAQSSNISQQKLTIGLDLAIATAGTASWMRPVRYNWNSEFVRVRKRCRKSSGACPTVGSHWKSGRILPGSVAG